MTAQVTVQCARCKATRDIAPYEIPAGDFPMCGKCYLPMCAVKVTTKPRKQSKT